MYKKTNSFLLCMDLQPYSHYCFSKISKIQFDFLNTTCWVSLFQRNNLRIFQTGVPCFSITIFYSTLFCCGRKANLVRFTLFYSTLLTLTHRRNDRWRNKYTHFAWAGGTFFPVVLLCQFLVLAGNRFWFFILLCTQSIIQLWCCVIFLVLAGIVFGVTNILRVQYSCAVVSFFCCGGKVNFVRIFLFNPNFLLFLVLAENSFWCYVHTQCTIQLCGCVSFFVVVGKLILYKYLTVTIVSQKYPELSL